MAEAGRRTDGLGVRAAGRGATGGPDRLWLFGLHAVRDALENPKRRRHRLIVTKNAANKLGLAIDAAGMTPEMSDARRFAAPLDPQSVHQGAALEVSPLDWGRFESVANPVPGAPPPLLVALDRVTDPHNVGAILRSAEVFGASAVIAPRHHSAPETGALAKSASGALERQPYLRVRNLGDALEELGAMGYARIGLDGAATERIGFAARAVADRPICLVLGAEGPGLRQRTRGLCDLLAAVPSSAAFASLNVSNAAAVALYAMADARAQADAKA